MRRSAPPLPGKKVRGSTTGRPLMAALDLLGRRYALRIVWELRLGPATFRELRTRCGDISPTSLNTRLAELREATLIEDEDGYRLSARGAALLEALEPLAKWADAWGKSRVASSSDRA